MEHVSRLIFCMQQPKRLQSALQIAKALYDLNFLRNGAQLSNFKPHWEPRKMHYDEADCILVECMYFATC